ncbi:MAG: hypothetical protein ABI686_03205 [Acidobacteriota bacterium]
MLICVEDEGKGINLKKLKAKAIEKKIISAEEILTEQATIDLVFQSVTFNRTESNGNFRSRNRT